MNHTLCFLATASSIFAADLTWQKLPSIPDPLGVAAPFAGVSNGELIVAGGANFPAAMPWEGGRKVWHDRIWSLDRPGGRWSEIGRLPKPLAYGVSITANGMLFCIGGSDAEKHHPEIFVIGLKNGAAISKANVPPPLPIPLANAAGAMDAAGNIYIAGGSREPGEKSASNRAFVCALPAETPEWKELPPLPAPARILPIASVEGSRFFLIGGAALEEQDGKIVRRYLRDAWSYSPVEGWKKLAEMPQSAVAAPSPAPVVDGKILIIAGDDGSLAGFKPVEKHPGFPGAILTYDIAKNEWAREGKAPAPRATLPVAVWNGIHVFPSGEVRPGVRSPEVWAVESKK